jgi:hypothetical protein
MRKRVRATVWLKTKAEYRSFEALNLGVNYFVARLAKNEAGIACNAWATFGLGTIMQKRVLK